MASIFSYIIFIVTLLLDIGIAVDVCHPKDQCSCKFDNGKEISLWPIDRRGSPRFKDIKDRLGETYKYSYNPCSPFTRNGVAGQCTNVLGCQSGYVGGDPVAIAYANKPIVDYDHRSNMYTFTYKGSQIDESNIRTLIIKLKCAANASEPKIELFLPTFENTFTTTLTSKYACPKKVENGLSIGSILCIVFLSLVVVYFTIGIAVNKFVKKKSGSDVIPQKQFWISVPGLVKDGAVFTIRKVRRKDAEYEKI